MITTSEDDDNKFKAACVDFMRYSSTITILFEFIVFISVLWGIIYYLGTFHLFIFLFQFPHLFLWSILFVGIVSGVNATTMLFTGAAVYLIAIGLDIFVAFLRFGTALILMTSTEYWFYLILTIITVANDVLCFGLIFIMLYFVKRDDDVVIGNKEYRLSYRLRDRLDVIWLLELITMLVLVIILVTDLDPSWNILFFIHFGHFVLWPFERVIAGTRGEVYAEYERSPSVIMGYALIYFIFTGVLDIGVFTFKMFFIINDLILGLYVGLEPVFLYISTSMSFVLGLLSVISFIHMMYIYRNQKQIQQE